MQFLPADYALGAFALAMVVLGLFRGFSGTLAFVAALAAATAVGFVSWRALPAWLEGCVWCGAAAFVLSLLAFGLVRWCVKRFVNKLLAQPSDALFGALLGAVVGVVPAVAWAFVGVGLDYSFVASEIARHVG